jgi:hypothetical protein
MFEIFILAFQLLKRFSAVTLIFDGVTEIRPLHHFKTMFSKFSLLLTHFTHQSSIFSNSNH